MYKKSDLNYYLYSFLESFSSFLFSINCHDSNLSELFVEYVVIYFPKGKAEEIIELMKSQEYMDINFLLKQKELLDSREKTSKKNIKDWVKNSSMMRKIFNLSLQVLEEPTFTKNNSSKHLKACIRDFLKP